MDLKKYPRTFHLPWSEEPTSDDKILTSTDQFVGKQIIITEKIDGENTTMYRDYIHARSLDSKNHPSRDWVKRFHADIKHNIPETFRICGENVFAKHSIYYEKLPSYFLVFGIYDNNVCLSWANTKEWCDILELQAVPELYVGPWDENKVKTCWTGRSLLGGDQEGYVVRVANSFPYEDFDKNVGKFVRKGHVTTSSHWMSEKIIPNTLQPNKSW